MNIQAEKIELAKLLLNTNNPKIIESIKQIFKKEKSLDFWDELSEEQQAEINQSIEEIINGNTTDYESFMTNHR